jgi:Transmembrane secretion effector
MGRHRSKPPTKTCTRFPKPNRRTSTPSPAAGAGDNKGRLRTPSLMSLRRTGVDDPQDKALIQQTRVWNDVRRPVDVSGRSEPSTGSRSALACCASQARSWPSPFPSGWTRWCIRLGVERQGCHPQVCGDLTSVVSWGTAGRCGSRFGLGRFLTGRLAVARGDRRRPLGFDRRPSGTPGPLALVELCWESGATAPVRARALGIYRLWREGGFAIGALLSGIVADALGIRAAVWTVATLTAASGLVVVAVRMYETHRRPGRVAPRGAVHG